MTQSLKDRIVELHGMDCRMAPKEIAAKAGCSIAYVAQVYQEFELRRYGVAPNAPDYIGLRKSPSPFAMTGKPRHFEPRRVQHDACQYINPRTGQPCGAESAGRVYCPECQPKTMPLGRARWSILETSKGLIA